MAFVGSTRTGLNKTKSVNLLSKMSGQDAIGTWARMQQVMKLFTRFEFGRDSMMLEGSHGAAPITTGDVCVVLMPSLCFSPSRDS